MVRMEAQGERGVHTFCDAGIYPAGSQDMPDVFRDVGIHPTPPEVPPHKLDCHLLSEVSCHFAIVFGFENGGYHELGNIEVSSIVEYDVRLHCQMLRWFDIIGAVWVSIEGTQT